MRYAILENNRVVKILDVAEDYVFDSPSLLAVPSKYANVGDYYKGTKFVDQNLLKDYPEEPDQNLKKRYHDVGKARRSRQFNKMSLQEQIRFLALEK